MISVLTPLPVLLPLLGAACALLIGGRHPAVQRTLSITVLSAVLAGYEAGVRVGRAMGGTPAGVHDIGTWGQVAVAAATARLLAPGDADAARRASATAAARAATVVFSKSRRSGRSTANASRIRESTRVASSEWPPRTKKSSSTPTRSRPSVSAQIAATVSSAGSRGAT